MKRFTAIVTTLTVLLTAIPSVQAAITNFDPEDGGVGTITGGPTGPLGTATGIDITKDYTELGTMTLFISVNSPGVYLINEDIVNNTSADWTDFHWELFEEVGNVTFLNVILNGSPFSNLDIMDTSVWLDGGVLAIGQDFNAQIEVQVAGTSGLFGIDQHPSVPLPGAIWMFASALGAAGFMRRRRRGH